MRLIECGVPCGAIFTRVVTKILIVIDCGAIGIGVKNTKNKYLMRHLRRKI
jgi:hypothetical protein